MGKSRWKKRLAAGVVLAALAGGSIVAWRQLKPAGLPDSFAVGNGRIEATEIDIATKTAGRITEILVNDGDGVEAGQVLARMDTQTLEAELRQAQAQVRQAQQARATATAIGAQRESAKATAAAIGAQRESAKTAATAVVAQRESALALADKELARSQQLAFKGAGSQQQLDTDYTRYTSTTAALRAAQSQLVEAHAAMEAALATTERLKAEIEDSVLKAPRSGRVQYRVVQPTAERAWRISELLTSTGLAPFADRPAGKLSGGMKQKLGLCCALIHDPDLLILDEPTTGVDPLSRCQFWDLIARIRSCRPHMSVLVATAYMDEADSAASAAKSSGF